MKPAIEVAIRKGEYHDSVMLMRVSEEVKKIEGIEEAAVLMATDTNKKALEDIGLLTADIGGAGPNDLVIVVKALSKDSAKRAMLKVEELFKRKPAKGVEAEYKSLNSALMEMQDANIAIISVPGEFAAWEAEKALRRKLNVFMFSSNVSIEDEVRLKKLARDEGLLMMGPDCGTAIINGVGLGFANIVNEGPIGVVGAAGTGTQEVTSIVSTESGISHAIGTGGRDLNERVGGIAMIEGIRALNEDSGTQVIVLIAKRPSPPVERAVLEVAEKCKKPVVVYFAGGDPSTVCKAGAVPAITLEETAYKALALAKNTKYVGSSFTMPIRDVDLLAKKEYSKFDKGQKYIRGLFSGGSFCSEAVMLLSGLVGDVYSNVASKPSLGLKDANISYRHSCIDLGDEEFVRGRAHPMIDMSLRQQRIVKEARDPETAVILLDVVLGLGAHRDPASALTPAIEEAKAVAKKDGRHLSIVASICGTDKDPQDKKGQVKKFGEAGVLLMPSNAQATRMAALIARSGKV